MMRIFYSGAYRKRGCEAENYLRGIGIMLSFHDWMIPTFRRPTKQRLMDIICQRMSSYDSILLRK